MPLSNKMCYKPGHHGMSNMMIFIEKTSDFCYTVSSLNSQIPCEQLWKSFIIISIIPQPLIWQHAETSKGYVNTALLSCHMTDVFR